MSGRLFADKEHPENNRIVLSALRDYRDRLVQAKHIIIVAWVLPSPVKRIRVSISM